MTVVLQPEPGEQPTFRRKLLLWAVLCLPLAYLVLPLGVLIHEVLGHGLTARLYGGWFRGFWVNPWGDGLALCDAPGFELHVVLAGSAAEAVMGLLSLLVARRLAIGSAQRVTLLLVSAALLKSTCFNMGTQYENGDFQRAANALGDPGYLHSFAVAGVAGFLAIVYVFARILLWEADVSFGGSIAFPGWRRATVVLLLVVLPGLGWLLPWIGFALDAHLDIFRRPSALPVIGAFAVHVVVALALLFIPGRPGAGPSVAPPGWRSLSGTWSLALVLFACAWFWWSHFGWWR